MLVTNEWQRTPVADDTIIDACVPHRSRNIWLEGSCRRRYSSHGPSRPWARRLTVLSLPLRGRRGRQPDIDDHQLLRLLLDPSEDITVPQAGIDDELSLLPRQRSVSATAPSRTLSRATIRRERHGHIPRVVAPYPTRNQRLETIYKPALLYTSPTVSALLPSKQSRSTPLIRKSRPFAWRGKPTHEAIELPGSYDGAIRLSLHRKVSTTPRFCMGLTPWRLAWFVGDVGSSITRCSSGHASHEVHRSAGC